jgi:predicted RNA methylase
MTGATGNIYVGLMEYEDMSFLLHYLQKDDLFYDIGANVGVYTVLTSQVKEVKTVSIEPLPLTYEKLLDNININRLTNVISKKYRIVF